MLEVRDLHVVFQSVHAVDGVSLTLPDGPFGFGIVGESGSGKTTIARAVMRLTPAAGGSVLLDGQDVFRLRRGALRSYRRAVQIVFQDVDSSLDPRMRVGAAIREALVVHRVLARNEFGHRVDVLLEEVGLDAATSSRFPHELSGGQRQRVAIARVLAVEPRTLILDEPTSALDVTVQARILRLIAELRERRQLSYFLVSHNLAVVQQLCEETAVLYLGQVVEQGPTGQLLGSPAHPYTRALRSAVPEMDIADRRERIIVPGIVPDPANPPAGCRFNPRCPFAVQRCREETPQLRRLWAEHSVACHEAEELNPDLVSHGGCRQDALGQTPGNLGSIF